ncbi:MAG TPA: carboxymuconolactone decarboxylase family protein [Streptosporangiaceae bacterium]|nr:carboxymuconolactone decarboxylase family protein [Streptosporangiaceae bacterium]
MPYIELHNDRPGIVSLFQYRPDTAYPLMELTEVLLRGPSTLSRGERELIATYVSALNECEFCTLTHATKATAQLPDGMIAALQSNKLMALLRIAAAVRQSGRAVTEQDVATARAAGATDREIHDTVLIAAAFCMFNRYVDGLGVVAPDDAETYLRMADFVMKRGYTDGLKTA